MKTLAPGPGRRRSASRPSSAGWASPPTAAARASGRRARKARSRPCSGPIAAALEMADLQYLEAHATATQLGDATEVSAVAEVLKDASAAGQENPHHQRQGQHRPLAGGGRPGRTDQDRAVHAAPACSAGDQRPQAQPEDRLGQGARLRSHVAASLARSRPTASRGGRASTPSASAA